MKKITIVLVTALLFAGTVFAASAFTTAELTRTANINVASDTNGIIALTPGSSSAVSLNSNGALQINAAQNATGLNVDGTFTYGSSSSPTSKYAFSMTNSDSVQHSVTISATNFAANQGQTNAVTYTVYDDTGSSLGTVTAGSSLTVDMSAGQTVYVTLTVNTTGLDSSADLSHTLRITA